MADLIKVEKQIGTVKPWNPIENGIYLALWEGWVISITTPSGIVVGETNHSKKHGGHVFVIVKNDEINVFKIIKQ